MLVLFVSIEHKTFILTSCVVKAVIGIGRRNEKNLRGKTSPPCSNERDDLAETRKYMIKENAGDQISYLASSHSDSLPIHS